MLCDLVVPHPQRDLLAPRSDQDWSIDALPEVPEARLRRMLWDELQRYRRIPSTSTGGQPSPTAGSFA